MKIACMNKQIIKTTIAQVIHLTPARQAEACYSVHILDKDENHILVKLQPSLDHLTWKRIGSNDRKALYESMVFHTGLAVGNLINWLEEHHLSYTINSKLSKDAVKFTDVRTLLIENINFIIEQTSNWIEAQRANKVGVFKDYEYESSKCHRDLKLVLDALILDLEYCTNENTCSILKEYFDKQGNVLVRQSVEIETYKFVKGLINNILSKDSDAIIFTNLLIETIINVITCGLDSMPDLINQSPRQEHLIEVTINV